MFDGSLFDVQPCVIVLAKLAPSMVSYPCTIVQVNLENSVIVLVLGTKEGC
jgi:hypothetical protein